MPKLNWIGKMAVINHHLVALSQIPPALGTKSHLRRRQPHQQSVTGTRKHHPETNPLPNPHGVEMISLAAKIRQNGCRRDPIHQPVVERRDTTGASQTKSSHPGRGARKVDQAGATRRRVKWWLSAYLASLRDAENNVDKNRWCRCAQPPATGSDPSGITLFPAGSPFSLWDHLLPCGITCFPAGSPFSLRDHLFPCRITFSPAGSPSFLRDYLFPSGITFYLLAAFEDNA